MLLKCLKWAYAIALKNSSFELFSILGLEHEASDNEIKKAYRKLSVHYRKLAPGDRCGISLKVVKVYRQLCDASSAVNYFMKPSLAPSKVMDVFTKAAEYMEIPVGRTDTELLQKLFLLVSSELNLELKNIKQEQANFWKQHPALVKVYCVMRAVPLSARKAIGGSGEGSTVAAAAALE